MPLVSVIIPCRNEEKTVSDLLEGLLQQTFPIDQTEILFSDGMSTDLTRQKITYFQLHHPECSIRILENSHQTIPAALNLAIANARGEYIVRLDAHSLPDLHYIEYCIRDLLAGKAENVGGVWQVKPGADTWIARSIAQAGSHPLGVGDARYRFATKADYVETVPFGAYNKELIDRIGGYDETLLANEDYEFNTRITKSGGKIWMNPDIQVDYFARSTFSALAKQYWNYGFWKAVMLQRYPETVRLQTGIATFICCRSCWSPHSFSDLSVFSLPAWCFDFDLCWNSGCHLGQNCLPKTVSGIYNWNTDRGVYYAYLLGQRIYMEWTEVSPETSRRTSEI